MSLLSSPLAARNTWEMELGTAFSAEWWQKALGRVNSTASCASLTLIQFKVLHRTHLPKLSLTNCLIQVIIVRDPFYLRLITLFTPAQDWAHSGPPFMIHSQKPSTDLFSRAH